MNKGKKVAIIATVIVVIGIIIAIVIYRNNWPLRFSKELNRFFGEGNWEYTSKETKESIMFDERRRNSATNSTTYVPGHYKNWEIEVNRNNKKEYWIISNHAYKINHDKHWFLSPKLYSAKEALVLELMNISEEIVAEKFKEEIPRYMIKHQVRPGITGWAQVNGYRGNTSIRKRIEYDLYYIENWTLGLDIKILFLTVFKGFINKNAY